METLYVLVISLWGLTASNEWVYVGNQMVLNHPMPFEECEIVQNNWIKHELNQFYRFSLECHEK